MKKIPAFVMTSILFVIFMNYCKCQPADNYYKQCEAWDTYFNSHKELTTEEDGDYKQYLRWKEFWRTRVDNGNTTQNGNFSIYRDAINGYMNEKSYYNRKTDRIYSDWHCLGPLTSSQQDKGLIAAIYVDTLNDKTLNTIYVGTNSSGIWRTTDGGLNWQNITDWNDFYISGISEIVGDPEHPDVLYAAAGGSFMDSHPPYSPGILKSSNRGQNWEQIFPVNTHTIQKVNGIVLDPKNSSHIFAIIDTAVWRSLDGGDSWDEILQVTRVGNPANMEKRYCRTIVTKPGTADTLYVATDDYHWSNRHLSQVWQITNALDPNPSNIIKNEMSIDLPNNGDTVFTERFNVAVTPANPEAVFVACNETKYRLSDSSYHYSFKMWKFSNNNWNLELVDSTISEGIGFFKFEFQASPTDENVIYYGGLGLVQEVNNGLGWHIENHTIGSESGNISYHVDTRKIKIIKGSGQGASGATDIIFSGNDGGISKSVNGSTSWSNLNGNGLTITQFWGIGSANSLPYKIITGAQDNFGRIYNNGIWNNFGNGDWGDILVDNLHDNTMYGNCFGSGFTNIQKTRDGWITQFSTMDTVRHENRLPNSPLHLNPGNPNTVYFGAANLFRSYHGLDTAFALERIYIPQGCDTANQNPMSAFCIAASDTNRIYVVDFGLDDWEHKHLFHRSSDHGNTWKNLTDSVVISQVKIFENYKVSDIIVSPKIKNTIWMTLSGFWSKNGDSARVIVSHDGGGHFSNYSKGLPNMPVNCIKFMNGGGDRLLVGTDVGVFYRDSTLNEWAPFNTMLPNCIVTDLEINDSINMIRASTFGRGLWETTLDCVFEPDNPTVIANNQHWINDTVLNNCVYVDSACTLTISSKVQLAPMAKIFVKQGARLVLDRGTLTNKCSNMWQGVEVWGRDDKPPTTLYQGLITLSNGAVIENSRIGITTCRKDASGYIDFSTTGGMVYCDGAIFKNNYKAVEIVGNPRGQYSLFRKTLFETTPDFIQGNTPGDFVSLFEANGVQFLGCKFINTVTNPDNIPGSTAGRGIFSINSTYTVDHYSYCPSIIVPCPNPVIYPCLFQGLRYGIRALGSTPNYPVTIRNSRFKDNYRSVYLSCVDYAEVTRDTFDLKNYSANTDTLYGLYISKSTGYKIQENRFHCVNNSLINNPLGAGSYNEFGIVIDSSGSAPNEIYKNYFDSLDVAINAQRLNRSPDDSTGLVIKCNTYNNNSYDEIITYQVSGASEGIALKQGSKTTDRRDPAGNTFSPYHKTVSNPSGTLELDIRNWAHPFRYFHHIQDNTPNAPRVRPTLVDTSKVLRIDAQISFDYSNCCPSRITTGGGIEDQDELVQNLAEEQVKVDSLTFVLLQKVDGGNTDLLNAAVLFSNPLQSLEIKENLIQKSPYLSDTVMKSAIEKESVLPNEMIRDIMVANPQFTQSENVLTALDNRFTPMPDYMLTEILEGSDSLSPKEDLDARLQAEILKRKYAFNELVRFYKNDTINPSYSDSLLFLLDKEPAKDAHYKLAFEYFDLGDTTMTNNVMTDIPGRFAMTSFEQQQHEDYLNYIAFLKSLKEQSRTVLQLNDEERIQLQYLRATSSDPVSMYCQNILEANGISTYNEVVLIPGNTKSTVTARTKNPGTKLERNYLKVFPNPARDYIIVEYRYNELLTPLQQLQISIISLDGKKVASRSVFNIHDQILLETASLTTGVYICDLSMGQKTIKSSMFSVIH